MTKVLYKSAGLSGGGGVPARKFDEFLFWANPADNFTIEPVQSYRRTEDPYSYNDLRPPVLHQLWDELMADFPDYVTKDILGMDASGEYEIARYIINGHNPVDNANRAITGRKIRIFLDCIHPELVNYPHMLEFVRAVLAQDSIPAINALKECCTFSCIPCGNPWGLAQVNNKRQNSNGVDLNQNFPVGWYPHDEPWDMRHGGTEALSEPEAQIMYNEMVRFKPDIHISFNSHGDQGGLPEFQPHAFFWTVPPVKKSINNTIWKGHTRACVNAKNMYPSLRPAHELIELRTPSATFGGIGSGRGVDTTEAMGAISANYEAGLTIDIDGAEGVKGSAEAITLGVMGALFTILEAINRMMYFDE